MTLRWRLGIMWKRERMTVRRSSLWLLEVTIALLGRRKKRCVTLHYQWHCIGSNDSHHVLATRVAFGSEVDSSMNESEAHAEVSWNYEARKRAHAWLE